MKSDQGWVKWSWGRCWKMESLSLHPHPPLEKAPGQYHHHGHGHGHHGHHHHHGHGHHLHPPLSHISIMIIACSAVAAWSGSEKSTLFIIPGLSYLDQSVTNIFEYSNILGTNIYSDIHSGQFCLYEYIRTFVRVKFVCTNIFRHSFMSVLESENRPNIRIYSNIRTIFNTNIYSDIRSCQIFYTNIFGHSFV